MIKPYGNRVLIRVDRSEKTESGFFIPSTALRERPSEGVVEAVGDDVEQVKTGDRVFFVRHGQFDVEKDGDQLIISEEDVLAKIV